MDIDIQPYEAFIGSVDDKDNFEIQTWNLDETFFIRRALVTYSLWNDKAPVLKQFRRDPSVAPLKLMPGKHFIIVDLKRSDRYYFDVEAECWYQF